MLSVVCLALALDYAETFEIVAAISILYLFLFAIFILHLRKGEL